MTPRDYILSRFRCASAERRGGVTTARIYGGAHQFALATLDAELQAMRKEGVLSFGQGLWFLVGGRGGALPPARGKCRQIGPVDRRADHRQGKLFE